MRRAMSIGETGGFVSLFGGEGAGVRGGVKGRGGEGAGICGEGGWGREGKGWTENEWE